MWEWVEIGLSNAVVQLVFYVDQDSYWVVMCPLTFRPSWVQSHIFVVVIFLTFSVSINFIYATYLMLSYIGFGWEYAATPTKGLSYHQGHRVVWPWTAVGHQRLWTRLNPEGPPWWCQSMSTRDVQDMAKELPHCNLPAAGTGSACYWRE